MATERDTKGGKVPRPKWHRYICLDCGTENRGRGRLGPIDCCGACMGKLKLIRQRTKEARHAE